jgi:CubicO group peptidase (beta-lactamase class C family)
MGLGEVYEKKVRKITQFDLNALPNNHRIDEVMEAYLKRLRGRLPRAKRKSGRLPGAAVMVRRGHNLIHLKGYGCANLETGKEISPETVFDLGSLSKQFTAFAALSVFTSDELELPISHFFRGFPRYADKIKIRHLIHHTSALPDYIDLHVAARRVREDWYDKVMIRSDDWYPQMSRRKKQQELTNKDVLHMVASQKLLPRDPDVDFEYSNTGYVLLAELVRRATGKRLASVLKDKVFSLVGMNNTYVFDETASFCKRSPELVNHAKCYNHVKDKGYVSVGYSPLNFVYGDGNIHTTIVDMAKWDAHLTLLDYMTICKSEVGGEKHAIDARSMLWSPVELKHNKRVEYGAGWNLIRNKYKGEVRENGKFVTKTIASRAEYHRGEWLGWRSYIARAQRWVKPEPGEHVNPAYWESMGIVVLTNNTVPATHSEFYACALAQQIARLCWGDFKKDNVMKRVNCALA